MNGRPPRASLADRTRARSAEPVGDPVPAEPQRHCWVVDGTEPHSRAPGLLVEWRHLGGSWQGRVAYVVAVDGQPTLVEAWVPASQLQRAAPA